MEAVLRQEPGKIAAGEVLADPDPEIVVHGEVERLIQSAYGIEDVPPEEG